jgi:hypothetical protein
MYRPTTSMSFASNWGSPESFKVSTWCGWIPRAAQIRCTAEENTSRPFGHRPAAPVRLPIGFLVQGQADDLLDLLGRDRRLGATPRPHRSEVHKSLLGEPTRHAATDVAETCTSAAIRVPTINPH